MWLAGDVVFLMAVAVIVAAWVRTEGAETRRLDARLDRAEAIGRQP